MSFLYLKFTGNNFGRDTIVNNFQLVKLLMAIEAVLHKICTYMKYEIYRMRECLKFRTVTMSSILIEVEVVLYWNTDQIAHSEFSQTYVQPIVGMDEFRLGPDTMRLTKAVCFEKTIHHKMIFSSYFINETTPSQSKCRQMLFMRFAARNLE